MRELTLVIPGLLWPAESVADVTRDLALPALSALLGSPAVTRLPAQPVEHLLAAQFGYAPQSAPYAALRVVGCGEPAGNDVWMGADPAHLRFARESLALADDHELAIERDEAAQLVAALNANFADVGEFVVGTTAEWHLRLRDMPDVITHPMSQALGRNIEAWLPSGAQGKAWRRTINEMQMLMHGHPVNAAREAAGRPTINTLWLWGPGRLAAPPTRAYDIVFADCTLAQGLARAANAHAEGLPLRLPEHEATRALALIDALDYAALTQNDAAWRAGLMAVEADWLAPALGAFKSGQLAALRLLLPGDNVCLEVECARPAWWKFWDHGMLLEDFVRHHAAP